MITYTCPKCGHELQHTVICTMPPINVVKCLECGYKDEQREKVSKVKYISHNVTKK